MITVLLVEDDEDTREVVHLYLEEEEGYTVIECATGPEAVQHLTAAASPLLVLLDYHLPGLAEPLSDFIARTPILRDRHAYLLLSAAHDAAQHTHGWLLVTKPFSLETLHDAMTATWEHFQQAHSSHC